MRAFAQPFRLVYCEIFQGSAKTSVAAVNRYARAYPKHVHFAVAESIGIAIPAVYVRYSQDARRESAM